MNIAIIGSREGFTKLQIAKIIKEKFNKEEDRLISGGARGVDSFANEIIESDDSFYKSPKIIRPINPANKLDYLFRNVEIITLADKIIVFWDGKSKGTKFVIDYAKARGKLMEIILQEQPKHLYTN